MWDDIAAWSGSAAGARVLQTAVVPALAILVAGVVAALIGRSTARAVLARGDRDRATAAVAAQVAAAGLAADGGEDGRHLARLRAEADVATRLLPLPGAALAADWASARIDALQAAGSDASGVPAVRDALVAWTRSPRKAKRLFAEPVPATPTRAARKAAEKTPADPERLPAPRTDTAPPAAEARPVVAETAAPRHAEPAATAPAPAAEAPADRPAVQEVPAWQRTKAGEQLREQRTAARAQPEVDGAGTTAPVQPFAPRTEAPTPPAAVAAPARAEAPAPVRVEDPTRKVESPAWLDDYDDEAQVTQNLTLRTPPPVAATSVRDRRTTGDDIVPRG